MRRRRSSVRSGLGLVFTPGVTPSPRETSELSRSANIDLMKLTLLVLVVAVAACSQPDLQPATTPETPALATSTTAPDDESTSPAVPATTTPTPSLPDAAAFNILFVGNSHTATHNVPAKVETLLLSAGQGPLNVHFLSASFLRNAAGDEDITNVLASGVWDVVVLQGQEISQSHTIAYSQEEAVTLAQLAKDAGARPLFFAEWRRRAVEETAYIEGIYDEIAEKSGAEVIPVGRTWDRFLSLNPDHPLWATDGNHSSADGAFLAAATIAYYIAGPDAPLTAPAGLESLLDVSRSTVKDYVAP